MIEQQKIGCGGFYLPKIYYKDQKYVTFSLAKGEIDYAELSKWNFPDKFLCFVMERNLLSFIDSTYPNPRTKNEVPIWFLISCQFVMRLYQIGEYHKLQYLLNAGSILTKFGFNVGAGNIGFNDKNKKNRTTAVHPDTVRKFFKDTKSEEIRAWYRQELQHWFRSQRVFDHQGIFILDQSRLVVPDNKHYTNAVKMPVDEHGQWYKELGDLTEEQKQSLVYHPCYTISTLLTVKAKIQGFHIAGYELGPGNEDELIQAKRLIPNFCRSLYGVMKLLIVDRGYIDGELINKIKRDYAVDILIPLKKTMATYHDAVALANMKNSWQIIKAEYSEQHLLLKQEITPIIILDPWKGIDYKLYATVSKHINWEPKTARYIETYGVLVSTKKFLSAEMMENLYNLRVQIEERFRQFKLGWHIADFSSPHDSLIESHVCFTLLTYSLLQLYLQRKDLQEKTNRMISTLRVDESLGKDSVLVYAKDNYGVFDLDDYTLKVAELDGQPKEKIKATMVKQKRDRLWRGE